MTTRPEIVTDEHLTYLDELRESGETNMFGAPAFIEDEFDVSKSEALDITSYWMATYEERQDKVTESEIGQMAAQSEMDAKSCPPQ